MRLYRFLPLCLVLAACVNAPREADLRAEYESYNCAQLSGEQRLIEAQMNDIYDQQSRNIIVKGTMTMMGYSVGDAPDNSGELPDLQKRQQAVQRELIRKSCAQPVTGPR